VLLGGELFVSDESRVIGCGERGVACALVVVVLLVAGCAVSSSSSFSPASMPAAHGHEAAARFAAGCVASSGRADAGDGRPRVWLR
jgi:hypothetical protein